MIKVSILVPIYNVDKYLYKCLKSIQEQSLKEIEIICLNDGSTDHSEEIVKQFVKEDSRFILINKLNSGYGHTMNIGLSKARGEYLGIVESDDFVDSNMFEKLYSKAIEKNLDVVKSDFYLYWSNPERKIPSKSLEQRNVFDVWPAIWSAIYKRSFIEDKMIKFLETPGASFQDTGFNLKVWSLTERYELLREQLVYYRQDNANSSVKSNAKIFHICEEFNEVERFLNSKSPHFLRRRAVCYLWNYRRLTRDGRKEFFYTLHLTAKSIFKDEDCLSLGFSIKQLILLWTAAYVPLLFKAIIYAFG